MADEFKETTTTSWGQRIIGSFTGIIVGVVLFIGAFPLIFWNEGRSVDRIKTLSEGRSAVVSVAPEPVDPAHNGALIHLSGSAKTDDILKDPLFGVQENALKLKRTVEMYQWKENESTRTEKNLGGSETTETTYSYEKVWSDEPIDSAKFKKRDGHENPAMPYRGETYAASSMTLGAFRLTKPFIEQISSFEPYSLSQQNFDAMNSRLRQTFTLNGDSYFSGDPANPQIGALRVSYGIIKPGEISVIGKQDGGGIQPYYTRNGDISLLEMGNVSAESMFASAESENSLITWLLRLVAFIMMWAGLAMVLGPIKVFGDVVPFIGSLFGASIGLISGLLALVLSATTIAIAWIVFRPVIGIVLLVGAGVFFFGGMKMLRGRKI